MNKNKLKAAAFLAGSVITPTSILAGFVGVTFCLAASPAIPAWATAISITGFAFITVGLMIASWSSCLLLANKYWDKCKEESFTKTTDLNKQPYKKNKAREPQRIQSQYPQGQQRPLDYLHKHEEKPSHARGFFEKAHNFEKNALAQYRSLNP